MHRLGSSIRLPSKRLLMLSALALLVFSSCGAGNSAQRKSTNEWLNSNIGVATVDDLISTMGPPQQTTETPEGTWYTWRKVNSGPYLSGGIGGGSGGGFFGIGMGGPVETGEELSCLFDRKTGRLSRYNVRQW